MARDDKSLFGKFETLMEDMFGSISEEKGGTLPSARRVVDSATYRTTANDKTMTLEVDLPGVDPHDVGLSYVDGRFVVEARRGDKKFTHRYILSPGYNPRSAQATMGNGQLQVVLERHQPETFKIGVKIV